MTREGVGADFANGKGIGILADGSRIISRAAICAAGVHHRKLGVQREEEFAGLGLYYGAGSSEAPLREGEHVIVVGGGNSAGQAATHFSRYAEMVTMIIRGNRLKETLSAYLVNRIESAPNIRVLTGTSVSELIGQDTLEAARIKNLDTHGHELIRTRHIFVCIGGEPQTVWASKVGILRDELGYILTGDDLRHMMQKGHWPLERPPYHLESSVPGVFAAGDVRHGSVKRCASAVGEGAMAVAFVHKHLSALPQTMPA